MSPLGRVGDETLSLASMHLSVDSSQLTYSSDSYDQTTPIKPTDFSDSSQHTSRESSPGNAPKSAKRKKAEALLERKLASKLRLDLLDDIPTSRSIVVPPCSSDCNCASSKISQRFPTDVRWCSMPITMPSFSWAPILQTIHLHLQSIKDSNQPYQLPGELQLQVVDNLNDLSPAIQALRDSQNDSIISIDLEWRPDFRPGSNNRISLIQLASATSCILLRMCCLGKTMPSALLKFFQDPSVTFVSFSWNSADESKMNSSFGIGRSCFARFVDLQTVAMTLGYHSCGLASLTQRVLGVTLPKNKSVTMSNWQQSQLTPKQIQYAALDALIAGHIYRGLRLWHYSPSPCALCKEMLGVRNTKGLDTSTTGTLTNDTTKKQPYACHDCTATYKSLHCLLEHTKNTGHKGNTALCIDCGRKTFFTPTPVVANIEESVVVVNE